MTVRLAIADDEALVRAGLRMLVEADPGISVVGEAENGRQAIEVARRTRPDVLLLDIRMPELDGLAAARRVLEDPKAPRIIMLTTFDEDENVFEALRVGASGFVLKITPPEQLLEAIHVVASGRALIDPRVTQRVIEAFAARRGPAEPPAELDELTAREREVLGLIARGLSNQELAATLFLSEATVKTHVNRIFMKLQLRDRVQLVIFAYEYGLVEPGDTPHTKRG